MDSPTKWLKNVKEFAHDARGYVLIGDIRDIGVAYSNRQAVYEWCGENKITVEYQGTLGGTDVWRVKDEQHRAWFMLKWEHGSF